MVMRTSGWSVLWLLVGTMAWGATYHVDSEAGSDANNGMSPDWAWKTLDAVNQKVLQPGDRLLFKAGSHFTGQLKPQGAGKRVDGVVEPVFIDMYGMGPLPRIEGQGAVVDTVLLRNIEHVEIANLDISNRGSERGVGRTGIRLVSDGGGVLHGIHISRLFVHDVNGDLQKNQEGCGIFFEARRGSSFDGLTIDHCRVIRADRNGICQRASGGPRSAHIVVRNNLLEDIGGDGIKIWGSDGALVECNVIRGGRMRAQDAAAGIWPFDADDTVIQYNEVSGMKGTRDGQGFDSDYHCHRTLIQYNFSHDNEGGFVLICAPGTSYCEGTVVRYNISQNDGIAAARVFHISGNVKNTSIYNNTIYVGPSQDLPLVMFTSWSRGNPDDTRFFNNIFYVDGKVRYAWGPSTHNRFESNVFRGRHDSPPDDEAGIHVEPLLTKPGHAGEWAALSAYRPASPDFPRGKPVASGGTVDILGTPLPANLPPCIGAVESPVGRN